ncbi:hypothetical protein MM239_04565 [Belliella sp. DSM 111904]|uniref:Lipocalin-like domain-containing protein n=1 Tax=Belliella filtrata TaxID=2923435 RepID=A0ABS9UWW7_9BACT|nr:hypothetical protein [Belliella filtrata]MCH7408657.1 hypothetical protein [Belliella filtrata]
MKKILLAFLFLVFFASCVEDEFLGDGEFPIGNWTISERHENGFSLIRNESLPENTYGYSFHKNGKMTSRTIAGFCGTPPVIYADYSGNWSNRGSIFNLNMGFWGGRNVQEWKVVSTNDTGNIVRIEIVNSESVFD